jgi:hypothetical protein
MASGSNGNNGSGLGENHDDSLLQGDVTGSGSSESKFTKSSSLTSQWLSDKFLRPAKSKKAKSEKPVPVLTPKQQEQKIKELDPLESKIGYLGAGLIAVLGLLQFLPGVLNPTGVPVAETLTPVDGKCTTGFHYEVVKGVHQCTGHIYHQRSYWIFALLILLFFAVAMAIAVKVKRRSFLAFVAILCSFLIEGLTGSIIIGLPYLVAGGWLIMRAFRVQRYGTTNAKEVQAISAERRVEMKAKKSGTAQTKIAPSGNPKPTSNKRYTPKQAPRKKVPPPE